MKKDRLRSTVKLRFNGFERTRDWVLPYLSRPESQTPSQDAELVFHKLNDSKITIIPLKTRFIQEIRQTCMNIFISIMNLKICMLQPHRFTNTRLVKLVYVIKYSHVTSHTNIQNDARMQKCLSGIFLFNFCFFLYKNIRWLQT